MFVFLLTSAIHFALIVGCNNSREPPARKAPPKPITLAVPSPTATSIATATNTNSHVPNQSTKRPSQSPLTDNEIQSRIEGPVETQVCTIGGIRYRYAWISQRGYYPRGQSL